MRGTSEVVSFLSGVERFPIPQPRDYVDQPPEELVAACAYKRWQARCYNAGHVVHGGDVSDWLDAERVVTKLWNELHPYNMAEFAREHKKIVFSLRKENIATRAYYLSLNRGNGSDPTRNWCDAEATEITAAFARAFVDFQLSRYSESGVAGHLGRRASRTRY